MYTFKAYRKPSEQLFPNRRPLSYPNFDKDMETYKYKICIWSDPGVNLPIGVYLRSHAPFAYPSKICTTEYIYTCIFLAHAKWTIDMGSLRKESMIRWRHLPIVYHHAHSTVTNISKLTSTIYTLFKMPFVGKKLLARNKQIDRIMILKIGPNGLSDPPRD